MNAKTGEKNTIGARRTGITARPEREVAVMPGGITAATTLGTPGITRNVKSRVLGVRKVTTGVMKRMVAGTTAPPYQKWVWMSWTIWNYQYML